jgi:NitT/TauT family transport system substrate-binding protein/putative hydroxymethylpyrimidine transport system substrate-binding protein
MSARGPLRLLAVLFLLAGCGGDESGGAQPVSLALDFQPNAAHAGVFTAARTGIDADRGLHLRIRTPSASTDSLKLLLSGRADASIIDIHDLGLARERGVDVVGVGAIVQRPLAAVIAKTSVSRPRDLQGRRVGVTGLPSDDAVLRAVVESDGGDFSRVRWWPARSTPWSRSGTPRAWRCASAASRRGSSEWTTSARRVIRSWFWR